MSATAQRPALVRIAALSRPHAARLAAAAVLGALAIGAGIGLMATSGYLISRAAQQPPILELSVAIVAVRFFGVSRAVLRYLERLSGHDATLRALGTMRARLFARLEPLVPGGLPGVRTGDLLSRFVADVDELQNLWLRAAGPMAVALLAGALAVGDRRCRPARRPRSSSPPRSLTAGVALPAVGLRRPRGRPRDASRPPARACRRSWSRRSPARPSWSRSARRTRPPRASTPATARCCATAAAPRSSSAFAEGAVTALAGLAVVGVLVVSVPAVSGGTLSGVLLGMLALLALAARSRPCGPLPAAAAHLAGTAQAARRVLDLTDRTPPVADPEAPLAAAAAPATSACAACVHATATDRGCSTEPTSTCGPAGWSR